MPRAASYPLQLVCSAQCASMCVCGFILYVCLGMTPFDQRAGPKDGAKVWRAN